MKNLLTQQGWCSANATVTGCKEGPIVSMRGNLHSRFYARNYYSVSFRYEAAGRTYDSDFTAYRPFEEGQSFPILFDPDDPQRNSRNDPQGDQQATLLLTSICIAAALLFLIVRAVHR